MEDEENDQCGERGQNEAESWWIPGKGDNHQQHHLLTCNRCPLCFYVLIAQPSERYIHHSVGGSTLWLVRQDSVLEKGMRNALQNFGYLMTIHYDDVTYMPCYAVQRAIATVLLVQCIMQIKMCVCVCILRIAVVSNIGSAVAGYAGTAPLPLHHRDRISTVVFVTNDFPCLGKHAVGVEICNF